MFCPRCGKELSDTTRFCGSCGYKLEESGKKKGNGAKTKKPIVTVLQCFGWCVFFVILGYFSLFHIPKSDWSYEIYGEKARITGYNGKEKDVVIPEKVKRGWLSYDVTSIQFISGFNNVTSIEIPGTITEISSGIFTGHDSLTNLVLRDGVTEIGAEAFARCSSLTSVEIPGSVTEIGWRAFDECSSLTNIVLQDGVAGIGEGAFIDCSSLESIELPGSVAEIGEFAFSGCSNVINIELSEGVTGIGEGAFWGCSSLTSIEIPDSVTEIGENAFWGCSSLMNIELPNGVYLSDEEIPDGCKVIRR